MTRITPRTCLWPLAISLSLTLALSIGLTFRSNHHCYAGTCGEWLFPLQARLHVVVWYCWLCFSITFLALRAFQSRLRRFVQRPILSARIPLLGSHICIGGLLTCCWILGLYGIIVGIWWTRLEAYFTQRGIQGGVFAGNKRLAAIALTGHLCDVTMGMAILPISRHSALASFFKLSVATTLLFHMLTAYALFILVTIHGLLYVAWVPIFQTLPTALKKVYPILNPTYLYHECWPGDRSGLGIWRASLIFSGVVAACILLLIFLTTLPVVRMRHFNVFYFTHLLGILAIIIICLHASTMLYCTAPGLTMWALDWAMRLYELWAPLDSSVEDVGKGWFRVSVPLPRQRLRGCACSSPLAHFYIHHKDSSIPELHPFTTTTHLASQNSITKATRDYIDIQFLFRKRGATAASALVGQKAGFIFTFMKRPSRSKPRTQWTNKLAGFAQDQNGVASNASTIVDSAVGDNSARQKGWPIDIRLEGPYFTPADPYRYKTVVCIVAGTGISGALAIVGAFKELEQQASRAGIETDVNEASFGSGSVFPLSSTAKTRLWRRCIVVWSVREEHYVELPELDSSSFPGLTIRVHLTGSGRTRLSACDALNQVLSKDLNGSSPTPAATTWVYISGPNSFIAAGEVACKGWQHAGLDWYGARWDI